MSACCLFFSIFLFLRSYGAWRQRPVSRSSPSTYGYRSDRSQSSLSIGCRSDPTLVSELLGGIPGFYVFENVWFRNGTFRQSLIYECSIACTMEADPLNGQACITPSTPHFQTRTRYSAYTPSLRSLQHLHRTSSPIFASRGPLVGFSTSLRISQLLRLNPVLIHEVSTLEHKWTGLYHYYHFVAEDLLGGLTALASVPVRTGRALSTSANGVVIPWQSGWKDVWGMNEMVLRGMFDNRESNIPTYSRIEKLTVWG